MTAIEKFTFALSFDDADNVIRSSGGDDEHYELGKKKKKKKEEEAPPPPPAIYTEEQANQMVAEAEKKGHEEGYAEGHRKGFEDAHQEIMASLEKAVGDVESEIAVKLDQIDEQQKRANAKINEDAIHVALGIVRKLAPAWSKQYQLTEIEDIIRQCLANLFDAPKVMIKVHPDLEKDVGEAAERIAVSRGFSGRVVVVGEPDVAVGDCQVSWGDGTAVRDSARVWSEINEIIDNAMSLHASEHGLEESDMGDPDIQDTRLPPEVAVQATTGGTTAPEQTPVDHAAQAAPQSANPVRTEQAAEQPVPQTEQLSDAGHSTAFESSPPEPQAPAQPDKLAPQDGDGTNARNMQTSDDDATVTSDKTLETEELLAEPSIASTQTAPEPSRDANNVGETAGTPKTQAAQNTAEQPTEADKMDAVKQPTKDAGDENG